MAYDQFLADRIDKLLSEKKIEHEVKKMFGGLCYLVDDKMCFGILQSSVMARIDPDFYEHALSKDGCSEMDFTGRAMKGFVYVDEQATASDKDLEFWIDKCIEFNPKAKSSKKKKKK